jgi:hypothetical protein
MVPDADAADANATPDGANTSSDDVNATPGDADPPATDATAAPDGGTAAGGDADGPAPEADPTYDVVYRATRDAMWDVVGTATLILFYLALAAIGFSVAASGLLGGVGLETLGIGAVGLLVGLFSAYRVYVLVTE